MNLKIEALDAIEAPLSNNFWMGFLCGAVLVALIYLVQRRLGSR